MSNETHITVIGRLTGDPELRFTPAGHAVANLTIASNSRTFDKRRNPDQPRPLDPRAVLLDALAKADDADEVDRLLSEWEAGR